ncbi:MAG: polymorphic toxin-type HINT domain-containing protein, partial [Ruminococcus bicirculans (ex Wegman et al. 2014)]|uniref:polymorphic toxin-type HINT domain-containing protein n=1 Tax=Ruminococcus bicirculans (ex Wegman et al. 2014) TaxID=1160721 RepID=UPI0039944D83
MSNIYCSTTVLLVENFDVELTDKPVKVYNFQVEDFHTCHVSGLAILVHNAGDDYRN